jgi:hypothetical protein
MFFQAIYDSFEKKEITSYKYRMKGLKSFYILVVNVKEKFSKIETKAVGSTFIMLRNTTLETWMRWKKITYQEWSILTCVVAVHCQSKIYNPYPVETNL